MKYPGYIMRQSLVDECQKRYAELRKESNEIYDSMEVKGLDQESKQALAEKYCSLIGEMRGLRAVNDWAVQHTAPTIPVVKQ